MIGPSPYHLTMSNSMNKNTIGYITLIFLLIVASFFSLNLYFHERTAHDELDIRTFPYIIGDWKGKDLNIEEYEYKILETRNLILREYVNSRGDKLSLFIIYSETNRSVFHPPEVCMVGSGIEILEKEVEKIDYGKNIISANKIYTGKGDYKGISLYCYKAGNLHTDKYYLQQAYFALNQLLGRHIRGATIRVSMQIKDDEKTTSAILKDFMKESAIILCRPRF